MVRKINRSGLDLHIPENNTLVYEWTINVVTPMVGGSARTGMVDQNILVRSQEIKGLLRFWWRTLQPCNNVKQLKKQEDAMWGSTEHCSPISLWVTDFKRDKMKVNVSLPGDIGFIFSGNKETKTKSVVDFSFKLCASVPAEYIKDFKEALLAFVLFGGVGGRTRRGCGTLYCPSLLAEYKMATIQDVINHFGLHGKGSAFMEYPVLAGGKIFYGAVNQFVIPAWEKLLEEYKEYRFSLKMKNPGNYRSNRSVFGKVDACTLYVLNNKSETSKVDRFPSPAILKVIKLEKSSYKVCLVLRQNYPDAVFQGLSRLGFSSVMDVYKDFAQKTHLTEGVCT